MEINSQILFAFTSLFCNATSPLPPAQDQLAADMYNFMAKEGEYGRFFVTVSPLPWRDTKAL